MTPFQTTSRFPFSFLFHFRVTSRFAIALVIAGVLATTASAQKIDVWIGTGGAQGVFHSKLDVATGKLSSPTRAGEFGGAGFMAMHPNGKVIYANTKQGKENGIGAFLINEPAVAETPELMEAKRVLERLAQKYGPKHPEMHKARKAIKDLEKKAREMSDASAALTMMSFASSEDGGAAGVAINKAGTVVMSAQYGGGSMSTYTLNKDGSMKSLVKTIEHGKGSGVNAQRQATAHPHWVGTSPDDKFLFCTDLGKDAVVIYQLDPVTGVATKHAEVATPPGSGPRHMKFHTSGKYIYVLNEFSLDISVFGYKAESAEMTELQLIKTLPDDLKDKHLNSAAEIRVHPTGKFVYSSNRGHDSVSVFSVDQETGKLTFVERESVRGAWPRNFNIDPSGKWLLAGGRNTNTLTVFEIDQESGELTYNRECVNVPTPICILFTNE